MDVVYRWFEFLFNFFNVRDFEMGEVLGVLVDVFKLFKWYELVLFNFFYFDLMENLIRILEWMVVVNMEWVKF